MDKLCIVCSKILDFKSTTGRCRSCQAKHRWAQPGFKEKTSATMGIAARKYHQEHPEAGVAHSKKMKQYWVENPDAKTAISERMKVHYSDLENRKAQSERTKHYYNTHPEAVEAFAKRMNDFFECNPDVRMATIDALKQYHEDNPDANSIAVKKYYQEHPEAAKMQAEHLARLREEFWADPENRKKASKFWREFSNDPENRAHNSETSKALWQDPEYREKGMRHIYDVFLPAAWEWQSNPENKGRMAENMCKQMEAMNFRQSSLELMVQDFLDANGISYIPQYKPDNFNRVYDFLLPDAMPPILIEVDGHYWHASEDALARGAAEVDAAKDSWAIGNGFDILRIPERDLLSVGVEAFMLDTRPEVIMEFF